MHSNAIGRLAWLALVLLACGAPIAAPDDAGHDASAPPTDAAAADAGRDAAASDAGSDAPIVDACVAETDAQLCAAAGAQCGEITPSDRCGRPRTAMCGTCPGAQTCGARATPNHCGYEHWDVTTIDALGDAGQALSLAAEGGRLWVAYRASSGATDTLRVAHYDASTWTVEDLDSGALVAMDTAIALDASGAPHVAAPGPVRGGTSSYAELFTRGTGGWARQATLPGSATSLGLALDASGHAQICAYDPPSGGFGGFLVHVSEDTTGTFTSRTIDGSTSAASRVGSSCSIAVGASGTLHAAYYDQGFGRLRYASRVGASAWSATTVDAPSGDFAGDYAFMRLAPDQTPTIVYRALLIGTPEIRRARLAASVWSHDVIEPGAGVIANHPSVAFDSIGAAHVTHYDDHGGGTLYYTHESASGWAREVVDVVGTGSGGESAIALGPSDAVDIVFYEASGHRLRHAHRVP